MIFNFLNLAPNKPDDYTEKLKSKMKALPTGLIIALIQLASTIVVEAQHQSFFMDMVINTEMPSQEIIKKHRIERIEYRIGQSSITWTFSEEGDPVEKSIGNMTYQFKDGRITSGRSTAMTADKVYGRTRQYDYGPKRLVISYLDDQQKLIRKDIKTYLDDDRKLLLAEETYDPDHLINRYAYEYEEDLQLRYKVRNPQKKSTVFWEYSRPHKNAELIEKKSLEDGDTVILETQYSEVHRDSLGSTKMMEEKIMDGEKTVSSKKFSYSKNTDNVVLEIQHEEKFKKYVGISSIDEDGKIEYIRWSGTPFTYQMFEYLDNHLPYRIYFTDDSGNEVFHEHALNIFYLYYQ